MSTSVIDRWMNCYNITKLCNSIKSNKKLADKPRDAFLQILWRGWPPENMPLLICVTCQIWSFCIKGCRHKYMRTPKLRALELHSLVMRGVADPKIHGPRSSTCQNSSSATKGVCKNITEPQKLGSAGTLPLWLECGWPSKNNPFPICITMSNLIVLRQRVCA